MICKHCNAELPEGSVFCGNCGKSLVENNTEKVNERSGGGKVDEQIKLTMEKLGKQAKPAMEKFGEKAKSFLQKLKDTVKDGKKRKYLYGGAVGIVVLIIVIYNVSLNSRLGRIEESIMNIDSLSEDEIATLYEEYESLSDSNQRKVLNRERLISSYQAVEQIIAERKQQAAYVDSLIESIDTSNVYAQANATIEVLNEYMALDEKAKGYCQMEDKLRKFAEEAQSLSVNVTESNLYEFFTIEYRVGEQQNYGSGTSITQDGYSIDWDEFGGTVTPTYDTDVHNDYATPVYIYVAPKYKNLTSNCSFYINLHQTYTGLGLVDSDIHEFELQEDTVKYDSSMGVGEYCIYVENNDAGSSVWNLFGMAADWSDMTHKMNPFDVSRVEISSVKGSVSY